MAYLWISTRRTKWHPCEYLQAKQKWQCGCSYFFRTLSVFIPSFLPYGSKFHNAHFYTTASQQLICLQISNTWFPALMHNAQTHIGEDKSMTTFDVSIDVLTLHLRPTTLLFIIIWYYRHFDNHPINLCTDTLKTTILAASKQPAINYNVFFFFYGEVSRPGLGQEAPKMAVPKKTYLNREFRTKTRFPCGTVVCWVSDSNAEHASGDQLSGQCFRNRKQIHSTHLDHHKETTTCKRQRKQWWLVQRPKTDENKMETNRYVNHEWRQFII